MIIRIKRRGKDKPDPVLPDYIGCPVLDACFQPGIGQRLESESRFIIMRCLFGISYIQFNIVSTQQRQKIIGIRENLFKGVVVVFNVF